MVCSVYRLLVYIHSMRSNNETDSTLVQSSQINLTFFISSKIVQLARCPWGPVTANGVDSLTEIVHRSNGCGRRECDTHLDGRKEGRKARKYITRQLPMGAGHSQWGGYTDRNVCNIKLLGPTVLVLQASTN